MYLTAAIYVESAAIPVKIRNMSSSGALVEGNVVPPTGSAARLVRGALAENALVAWSAQGRCGLKFPRQIEVERWLAPPANGEQQRVDELVGIVRAGAVPFPHSKLGPPGAGTGYDAAAKLAEDICRISALLDSLADDLASDASLVARHGDRLQNLDIAVQMLSAIGSLLPPNEDGTAATEKLECLRRSALQALESTVGCAVPVGPEPSQP
jgi:hypothetical protein